jgi:hypothetical protein
MPCLKITKLGPPPRKFDTSFRFFHLSRRLFSVHTYIGSKKVRMRVGQ